MKGTGRLWPLNTQMQKTEFVFLANKLTDVVGVAAVRPLLVELLKLDEQTWDELGQVLRRLHSDEGMSETSDVEALVELFQGVAGVDRYIVESFVREAKKPMYFNMARQRPRKLICSPEGKKIAEATVAWLEKMGMEFELAVSEKQVGPKGALTASHVSLDITPLSIPSVLHPSDIFVTAYEAAKLKLRELKSQQVTDPNLPSLTIDRTDSAIQAQLEAAMLEALTTLILSQ